MSPGLPKHTTVKDEFLIFILKAFFFKVFPYLRKWDHFPGIKLETCESFFPCPPPAPQHSFHQKNSSLPQLIILRGNSQVAAHQSSLDTCRVVSTVAPSPCSTQQTEQTIKNINKNVSLLYLKPPAGFPARPEMKGGAFPRLVY